MCARWWATACYVIGVCTVPWHSRVRLLWWCVSQMECVHVVAVIGDHAHVYFIARYRRACLHDQRSCAGVCARAMCVHCPHNVSLLAAARRSAHASTMLVAVRASVYPTQLVYVRRQRMLHCLVSMGAHMCGCGVWCGVGVIRSVVCMCRGVPISCCAA